MFFWPSNVACALCECVVLRGRKRKRERGREKERERERERERKREREREAWEATPPRRMEYILPVAKVVGISGHAVNNHSIVELQ